MSPALTLPRVRGPGIRWLPRVLRRPATWRTVWRFVWAGPLIGGLPYVWLLFTVPFAYLVGVAPAAVAGLLFACWYHGQAGRAPTWPWRLAMGALAGAGATAGVAFWQSAVRTEFEWFLVAVVAVHGIPAAVVLGLLQKPASAPRAAPGRPAAAVGPRTG